ncbi:MAG: hypothetical protein GEU71_11715 [Actinobacteria bacterium]|nr:hypothetical protein [Actinomycetota bacterium]
MRSSGEGAVDFDREFMDVRIILPTDDTASLDSRIVVDGDSGYLAVPEALRNRTGGLSWVGFPLVEEELAPFHPKAFLSRFEELEELEEQGAAVERVGNEVIEGLETTQYRVTKEAEVRTGPQGESLEKGVFEAHLWLSSDGFPVRTEWSTRLSTFVSHGSLTLFALGEPLDTLTPPEDEVIEAESLQAAVSRVFRTQGLE